MINDRTTHHGCTFEDLGKENPCSLANFILSKSNHIYVQKTSLFLLPQPAYKQRTILYARNTLEEDNSQ